jgi:hypothetical protein
MKPTRVYRLNVQYPERNYLSRKGADYMAGVFRGYGAKVTVIPSLPVQWPPPDGES